MDVPSRDASNHITRDEGPVRGKAEKIPTLRPAFKQGGTITAASSASISDGAAAVALMDAATAQRRSLTPLARIVGHAQHARAPSEFTLAPVHAIAKL